MVCRDSFVLASLFFYSPFALRLLYHFEVGQGAKAVFAVGAQGDLVVLLHLQAQKGAWVACLHEGEELAAVAPSAAVGEQVDVLDPDAGLAKLGRKALGQHTVANEGLSLGKHEALKIGRLTKAFLHVGAEDGLRAVGRNGGGGVKGAHHIDHALGVCARHTLDLHLDLLLFSQRVCVFSFLLGKRSAKSIPQTPPSVKENLAEAIFFVRLRVLRLLFFENYAILMTDQEKRRRPMHLIVTLDEQGGMLFNHRRQSRDRVLTADLLRTVGNARLVVSPYTAKLFADIADTSSLVVAADPLAAAGEGDFCFLEENSPGESMRKVSTLILYRWNRHYPADVFFDADLREFTLTQTEELEGFSHKIITKEVYQR